MRIVNKDNLVEITAEFTPEIKTIKEVMHITGKPRQLIEYDKSLRYGLVLANEETGDLGVKVIIHDKNLDAFIEKYRLKDEKKSEKKRQPKRGVGRPKQKKAPAKLKEGQETRSKYLNEFLKKYDQ